MILTVSTNYSCGNQRGMFPGMDRSNTHSIAYDLLDTDLSSVTSLTEFIVAHTVAPLRAAAGLPAPRVGELATALGEVKTEGYLTIMTTKPWTVEESSAIFDESIRALLLFGWLFPESMLSSTWPEVILESPGSAVLTHAWAVIPRSPEAVADLVAGLLGAPTTMDPGYLHRPARNDAALAELEQARQLVLGSLDPMPTQEPVTQVIDIGLDRIGWWPAFAIDRAMRSDVRRRLVWFGTLEPTVEIDDSGEPNLNGPIVAKDRGVFAADVPESITGLVLLDLSEQLRRDRRVGRCGQCGRLMPLNAWQSKRARRGDPVYHADCRDTHRLVYFRQKAHDRYHAGKIVAANEKTRRRVLP
jgi:hypothetical protein